MIMMMTDPDRVALSAFLPAFLFRFFHPFMPTSTPTFHRNVPPAFCHTSYYPVRSSSSVSHRSKFGCFLPHFSSTFWHACLTLHYFSRLLSLRSTSQPVFFHFYLFCTEAANNHSKKTCNQSHIPPSSPHSLQACTRTRTYVRLSMYLLPVAVFISHQKEGFVREERHQSPKKRRS